MEPRAGDLILQLEEARPSFVRLRTIADNSHMTHFLRSRASILLAVLRGLGLTLALALPLLALAAWAAVRGGLQPLRRHVVKNGREVAGGVVMMRSVLYSPCSRMASSSVFSRARAA